MHHTHASPTNRCSLPSAKPRVAVVEDDVAVPKLLCDVPAPFYEVEAVADGALTWVAVQRSSPALLVTDLQIPNLDGAELVRRVRAQPSFASLPIVIFTASRRRNLLFQCLSAGADDFFAQAF